MLAACERLGAGFVPYSPLGRDSLTGALRSPGDFAPDNYRPPQSALPGRVPHTQEALAAVFPRDAAAGLRNPQAMMGLLNA